MSVISRHVLTIFPGLFLALLVLPGQDAAADDPAAISINADFPGGNIVVAKQEDETVHVAPDLRGDRPWFYWCFEAKATKAGRAKFVFPERVAGFKDGAIGFQGPAISTDAGKTWKWMGLDSVNGSSFFYDFAKVGQSIRFAVTIPYVQANLDTFLRGHADNPHLKTRVLTNSRHRRDVELLQIGEAGPGIKPVLVTGRHHAAETMASYVLEGFLQEAMSDSPAGVTFRKKHVLFAVPFVDKDGVEEGDQGKNRKPHDHNRDYGDASIYPEIRAIKALDSAIDFKFALDFHCPTLVMQDHQVMYFVGARVHPQYNFENVSEFASWIKKGLPQGAPHGPLVWLRDEDKPSAKNSRYFGFKTGAIMAATFEFPFAPPNRVTDPASCRKYGQVMLEAWVNTHFREPELSVDNTKVKMLRPHPDALPNSHKPGEVDNPELVPFVVADKTELPGIVVDETEATLIGEWRYSTHTPPYVGVGYLHDQKVGKGESSVTYTPALPQAGVYEVRLSHCYNIRRSTNTPVTIHHADGETTFRIDQQEVPEHKRLFRTLGKYRFNEGRQGWLRISTDGTDGKYVIADAVQFIPSDDAEEGGR